MSKKAAGLVWSRMTEDVRQLAMASLPAFRAYCTSKPEYRPVHAVRYLTQERFVGFSEVVSKAAGKVFVAKGTPQWTAWQRVQHSSCVTSAEHRQDGWWFESEWPNGEPDERKPRELAAAGPKTDWHRPWPELKNFSDGSYRWHDHRRGKCHGNHRTARSKAGPRAAARG
jgi:hypothetical protein